MQKIVVNQSIMSQLPIGEIFQLCDESGQVVGCYVPAQRADEHSTDMPFTDEELDEFAKQKGGRPLKDILANLGRLG